MTDERPPTDPTASGLYWRKEVRTILVDTRTCELPEVVENRKETIDYYVSRGRHNFWKLI